MNDINLKDKVIQRRILNCIKDEWNFGIQPSGRLAKYPYLSEKFQPHLSLIRPFKKEDINVLSDTDWTQRLIEAGIFDKKDGITIHSLSTMRSLVQREKEKTENQIKYKSIVRIDLSKPDKIIDKVKENLEDIENQYAATKGYEEALDNLNSLFENYGFLWPERIIVGYKQTTHMERSAACETDDKKPNGISSEQSNWMDLLNVSATDDSIEKWSIIKRKNLRPIYEFIPRFKKFILKVLRHQIPNIKLNTPICWDQNIKLKNIHSKHYLTRNEHMQEEYMPSLCRNRSDDHCTWSFQKPKICHRRLSEVLQGSENVFLCSPKYQIPDIEHLVITSEGTDVDSQGIHHVHLSMDFHEKTNEWILETRNQRGQTRRNNDESLDDAIKHFECLSDGDKITLKQSEVFLSTNESIFDNIKEVIRDDFVPFMREIRQELAPRIFSPLARREQLKKSSKSCILPAKTYDKLCTHSDHRCGSHLMVKKPWLRKHSEYIWKIEVVTHQEDHLFEPSNHSGFITDTSHTSEIYEDSHHLKENIPQPNVLQSNLDLLSQPDSTIAIRSRLDLTSRRCFKSTDIVYDQDSDSSSDSDMSNEIQSIASGPNIPDKGKATLNSPSHSKNRTDAQAYKMLVEKYFRKSSDSILYSKSNTQSSSFGTYINENDGEIYTLEPIDNENTSIKTQKKRMKLLLGLGKKKLKKNTMVTYLRRATLTSFVPDVSKLSFKKSRSNRSSS